MEVYMTLFSIILHRIPITMTERIRGVIVRMKLYFKRIKEVFLNYINY